MWSGQRGGQKTFLSKKTNLFTSLLKMNTLLLERTSYLYIKEMKEKGTISMTDFRLICCDDRIFRLGLS